MNVLRRILLFLIGFIIILMFIVATAVVLITEDHPLVLGTNQPDPQSLIATNNALKQFIADLNYSDNAELTLTHSQIDHLVSYISHSFPVIMARYNYAETVLLPAVTIRLPAGPWGRYLNISSELIDGKNLFVGSTKIGAVNLSNRFLLNSAFFLSSFFVDKELPWVAKKLLSSASFSAENINLTVGTEINSPLLVDKIKQELRKLRVLAWEDSQFSSIEFYYAYLSDFSTITRGIDSISLFDLLKPLFKQVKMRASEQNASSENTQALLALALVVGDYRLKQFLSRITGFYKQDEPDFPAVLISGRKDLMLHFLYSVTIQLLSAKEISLAAGELKEILDMNHGGSGFSFSDLAADRAGVQFASMATDRRGGDLHLQDFIARSNSEKSFIPDIIGLPDLLSVEEFKIDYKNTGSSQYKIVEVEIDRRIQSLPLYQAYGK